MKTKLATDKGVVSFKLPDCPICGCQPESDMFRVKCGCRKTSETPIEYIKRCAKNQT